MKRAPPPEPSPSPPDPGDVEDTGQHPVVKSQMREELTDMQRTLMHLMNTRVLITAFVAIGGFGLGVLALRADFVALAEAAGAKAAIDAGETAAAVKTDVRELKADFEQHKRDEAERTNLLLRELRDVRLDVRAGADANFYNKKSPRLEQPLPPPKLVPVPPRKDGGP